jgi:putative ABC transport system permease protein
VGEALLVDVKAGVSPDRVARTIERSLFAVGVDATTTKDLLDKGYSVNRTFFSVIQVLMQMGLVVGILSLGILALRAVVERRHIIGVLRAVGYRKRRVLLGLLAEAGVSATIGVLVGVAAGLTLGLIYLHQFGQGRRFGVDGPTMWGSLALMYIAVQIVAIGPAWRASRLPPAEAVRYSE